MLNVLRKKASSFIVKLLLGSLALVFILYFGSTPFRDDQNKTNSTSTAAYVDNYAISENELVGFVRLQKEMNPFYQNLPENLESTIKQSALNALIDRKILELVALKEGLRVTKSELAENITSDPSLVKDGKFDVVFYHERFRPGYYNRYGIDFETWTKQGLLMSTLKTILDKSFFISDEQAKLSYLANNTKISFKKITLNPDTISKNNIIPDELWPLFLQNKLSQEKLKQLGLNEKSLNDISISGAHSIFENGFDANLASEVFKLTPSNPYPSQPLKLDDTYYFFKLVSRIDADLAAFEKNKVEEVKKTKETLAEGYFENWLQKERDQRDIRIL